MDVSDTGNDDMLPFQLPQWIDEIFNVETSIYYKLSYRSILNMFFDRHHSIYKIVKVKITNYYEKNNLIMLSHEDRTTYLLSLIDTIDLKDEYGKRMKIILKIFLQFSDNINFFHPHERDNPLIRLKRKLQNHTHIDIMDILLQRKEILTPSIIIFLTPCIFIERHIKIVLDKVPHLLSFHTFFNNLLENYITKTTGRLSKQLICHLITKSRQEYFQFRDLFISPIATRTDLIDYIPYIKWENTENFDLENFCLHIQNIYRIKMYYLFNCHALLHIYRSIVCKYEIILEIPRFYIINIVQHYRRPEQLLMLEYMDKLAPYKNLLPPDLPTYKYIQKRYKIRYGPFIYYWKHKTYSPGSKCYQKLYNKYTKIMYGKNSASFFNVQENETCINYKQVFNFLDINPFISK